MITKTISGVNVSPIAKTIKINGADGENPSIRFISTHKVVENEKRTAFSFGDDFEVSGIASDMTDALGAEKLAAVNSALSEYFEYLYTRKVGE